VSKRRRILIIGDSISMGYAPRVAEVLAGTAEVVHNPGNAGDTDHTAAEVGGWLADARPDVVHFNCGLHDIKVSRETHVNQVPLPRYRTNLEAIVAALAASKAALIWATTTPVVESRHTAMKEFDRYNRDVDAYNAAAVGIVAPAVQAVNDLHAVAVARGSETLIDADGVHFTDAGYRILADVVAERLMGLL